MITITSFALGAVWWFPSVEPGLVALFSIPTVILIIRWCLSGWLMAPTSSSRQCVGFVSLSGVGALALSSGVGMVLLRSSSRAAR